MFIRFFFSKYPILDTMKRFSVPFEYQRDEGINRQSDVDHSNEITPKNVFPPVQKYCLEMHGKFELTGSKV